MKKKKILPLLLLSLAFVACQEKKDATAVVPPAPETRQVAVAPADSSDVVQTPPVVKSIDAKAQGDAILNAIAEEHKGKVTVIDIWATWCGPCTRAMEEMHDLKKELQAKGVAFVYLTDESSPAEEWEQRIQVIQGTHYRLPEAQMATFELVGYPSFIVLDKTGKVAFDNRATAGFPGAEAMAKMITPLLK